MLKKIFGSSNRALNRDYVIAADDRVPLIQKIAYGFGSVFDMWGHWLYPTIAFQIFGSFLGMPWHLIGIAVILNRVFDAVSDPVFGWLSDNARTRWGRRRPYMLAGCLLAALGLPFLLAVETGWSGTHYFVFMLISSAIYLPIVSCFNMPYQSLANELTPDYHERTAVFAVKNAVQKIPELGLFFFGRFFSMAVWVGADSSNVGERIKHLFTSADAWRSAPDGAQPNMLLGAQVYLAFCGVIMLLAGLACIVLVKERYYGKLVAHRTDKVSIWETIYLSLKCRPFLIQKVMDMGYNMGLSMVGTLGLANTIFYVCGGNKSEGNFWNFLMGVSGMVLGLLGIPTFTGIARAFGKRQAMAAVQLCGILIFLASWWLYTPEVVWLQVFASGFIAFIGAGYWTLAGSMGADVMDYDELEGGRRREGSFAACGSWINKVAMAIGAGISFFILGWIGLEDNRPEAQAAQAGQYQVVVTDGAGKSTTTAVRVEIEPAAAPGTAPSIIAQPVAVTATEGSPAVLNAGVRGAGPLQFEWSKDGAVLPKQKRAQLVFEKVAATDAGTYQLKITNAAGSVSTAPVAITVAPAAQGTTSLQVLRAPRAFVTTQGQAATLDVHAVGGAKLSYQWLKDGVEIPGAKSPVYSLTTTKQPDETIFMIRFLFALIPILGLIGSLIALSSFPLTQEKMAEIRAALEARRGKA